MRVETSKFRAATKFAGKSDVREYLCGVRVNGKYIEAVNGHIAVRMDSGVDTDMDVIIDVSGKIPKNSQFMHFVFGSDKNTVYHYNSHEIIVGAQVFSVKGGKFPDLDGVIPKDFVAEEFPMINALYLKVFYDAFAVGVNDQFGVKAVNYKLNEKIICKLSSQKSEIFGNPIIVIMAMNEGNT